MTTTIFQSPLEQFEIYTVFSIVLPFLGYKEILVTNIGIYFSIITFMLILWNILAFSNKKIIGNSWRITQESLYMTVLNIIENQIGSRGYVYFPFIFSIFVFILLSNFIGMIPYSFAVTSHLVFTVSLSMVVLIGATIIGLKHHGWNFFSFFIPSGVPSVLIPFLAVIELVLYISRGFSLGIRLGANVLAGHMLMKIIAGFIHQMMISGVLFFILGLIPLALLIAISGLELAISFIQAYVFIVLTSSYIRDSIYLH
uniref:ATP synthase subunit a n=1 Tax=Pneumocystis carinii TaxID=4754 RepID=D2XDV0_PNECA|nr:ATP synthase subunit 6 [Pneumocystis carinii]ACZ82940.1 ATP synthase subunit 6 [Pneumocystis carinii]AFR90440.1 ATP synthase subunit 6 [Pneumocystis carinii]